MDRLTRDLITRAEQVAGTFRGDADAYADWAAFQPRAAVRAIRALTRDEFQQLSPAVQALFGPIRDEQQAA